MTDQEKEQIEKDRREGLSYRQIAKKRGLSVNSVKSYCQRHGLGGTRERSICEQCGRAVRQVPGRKHKRFCSDACRMRWWNSHQDLVHRRSFHEWTCRHCGKAFTAYGSAERKYCCHACYIRDRFGGRRDEDEAE